jgi:hypothetical protein
MPIDDLDIQDLDESREQLQTALDTRESALHMPQQPKYPIPGNCGECTLVYSHCYDYCMHGSSDCIENLIRHGL